MTIQARIQNLFCLSLLPLLMTSMQARAELVLTMGGDLNLNAANAAPHPQGGFKWGQLISYDQALRGLKPLVTGDLNFANIETVISDRKDLSPEPSSFFPFVMHPKGVEAVISSNFNLLSLSNNHSGDYGFEGLAETWSHMQQIQQRSPHIGWHGVGQNFNDATTPLIQQIRTQSGQTYRIAFAAVTGSMNWDYTAKSNRPGVVRMQDTAAMNTLLNRMKNADVDLRLLSVHFGKEKFLNVEPYARDLYRRFIAIGNIDVVIGHHPHRVRPIEKVARVSSGERDDALIFYSLGNLQMFGAAGLNGLGEGHDYGLWGKVFFNWNARAKKLVAQATEATALTDMHTQARPLRGAQGQNRILFLNQLNQSQFPSTGLQFATKANGSGISCFGLNPGPQAQQACR